MTDTTLFDHRASIVDFILTKAQGLDEECAAAEAEFEETDCHETMEHVEHLAGQVARLRTLAAQVSRGDDLPLGVDAKPVARTSKPAAATHEDIT